jgi:hypothetical protein
MKQKKRVMPTSVQPLVWSKNIAGLDPKNDREVIINRVLAYGSLIDLRWLFRAYSKKAISSIFLRKPEKIYSKPSIAFVNRVLLKRHNPVTSGNYEKLTFRNS